MPPAGRPSTFPIKKIIGFDEATIAMVDDWRRTQPEVPNFSDAVRSLIGLGIEAAKGSPSKSRRKA